MDSSDTVELPGAILKRLCGRANGITGRD